MAAGAPSRALADGDPASDVLASQPLFAAADGGFAPSDLGQLNALLASAQRQGTPVRVALISSPADLGSVSELWRKPQSYAQYLGEELAQVYRSTVVVVMPNGVGTYATSRPRDSLVSMAVPPRTSLITAAVVTVQGLARSAGHPLRLPAAAPQGGAASWLSSVDLGSWLVLAGGAALIAAAWTASLRARPARRLRRAR
ncbi:MAG: hypothetical protein ACXVE8_16905 [Solirubrobacteraceae bacterium]